jgi:signal transduction histidine kinase
VRNEFAAEKTEKGSGWPKAGGYPDMLGLMARNLSADHSSGSMPRALMPLALALLWTLVGLLFATAGGGIGPALKTWYLWGLLAWAMVLVDRRLPVSHEQLRLRLLWHVPLSLLFSVLYLCLSSFVDAVLGGDAGHAPDWGKLLDALRNGGVQWNLLNYWLILGAYLAFEYHREAQERRARAAHLESLLTEARLSALRAQLNPHFLFNALNTVSAYVETDPRLARAMLGNLGDLLRFSLDSEDQREVSLAREMEALDHYLAIQCARFGERLRVHVDIPSQLLDARVPGLLLQPLVENAITHGLCDLPGVGEIRVSARESANELTLTVRDNGIGLPAGWRLEDDAGIGLSNTHSRLSAMYGVGHRFSVEPATGGGVVVEIRIPCVFASSVEDGGQGAKAARVDRR